MNRPTSHPPAILLFLYGVWYGEGEALCLNVMIIEAKGPTKSNDPIAQLLAYMGMYLTIYIVAPVFRKKKLISKACMHHVRKSEGKRNCAVYGAVSTGETWNFVKISMTRR